MLILEEVPYLSMVNDVKDGGLEGIFFISTTSELVKIFE